MRQNIGHQPDEPVPAGVNYDLWTGPVPMLAFNRNRFHSTVNWHWHYGAGDIGNDGVHWLDMARWALGVDYPLEVSGMGRKLFFDDDQQTPDTQNLTFSYKDHAIAYEQRLWNRYGMEGTENGVAIYATGGMAQTGRWTAGRFGFRVFDEKGKLAHFEEEEDKTDDTSHYRNFVACVRTRNRPEADIEVGHVSTVLCHLGNIVTRTGRNLRFDAATETVLDDPEASRLVTREYRDHWSSRPLRAS